MTNETIEQITERATREAEAKIHKKAYASETMIMVYAEGMVDGIIEAERKGYVQGVIAEATRDKWIKVEDALPEDELVAVMVKANTGYGHYQYFAAFLGADDDRDIYWVMDLPKHVVFDVEIPNVIEWMSLPTSPTT